jgi:voltage-gated potassium channel
MRHTFLTAEGALGSPVRNLVSILVFVLAVMVLATIAYMAAGWSLADASYMVVLTIYSVGYGEVRPIDTPYLHAVTMSTMVLGCTGMILLTSALVQFFTVVQLRQLLGTNRMKNRIEALEGHVVICGYGRMGSMLARDLAARHTPLIVLERSQEKLAEAEVAGHLCLAGDATEEQALLRAGIERARVLATVLPDDAANVFITLSARSINPALEIIARGEVPSTESKLRHAGADRVVLPTHIGAERIAHMILHPHAQHLDDERLGGMARDFADLGLGLERIAVAEGAALAGGTVGDAERRGNGAFFIVHIERDSGEEIARPGPDVAIAAGDRVLLIAREGVTAVQALFTAREKVRAGRNVF